MAKKKRANKNENTRLKIESDIAKEQNRFTLWRIAMPFLGWTLLVLSLSGPLSIVYLCVDSLAGKDTTVSIYGQLALGGIGGVVILAMIRKMRSQKNELIRTRKRLAELEGMLLSSKADEQNIGKKENENLEGVRKDSSRNTEI